MHLMRRLTLFLPLLAAGCVGPATPFGALNSFAPGGKTVNIENSKPVYIQGVQIRFKPERMVLHARSNFEVEILDPDTINSVDSVRIIFDDIDVTDSFLTNGEVVFSNDQKRLVFRYPRLRLPTDQYNKISVAYYRDHRGPFIAHYAHPFCPVKHSRAIASTRTFNAPVEWVSHIDSTARKSGINPTLLAGIVAQESGFDPNAISTAKALGLTQITPIAERELLPLVQDWPRHPNINSMSYQQIRSKIRAGTITSETEWRLNPEKSIIGGVAYLEYLVRYWSIPSNRVIIESLEGDFEQNHTEIILASYNSGATRVKNAIANLNEHWRQSNTLREANRYVNRVSSYCYHFSSNREI